jgi:hypothetical protein
VLGLLLGAGLRADAEPFQNLDFESAFKSSSPPSPPAAVLASLALPGWTSNNYKTGYVIYDNMTLDSVGVSIHDDRYQGIGDFQPLDGTYTLMLQTSTQWTSPPNEPAYISQSGDIPSWARSITFLGEAAYGPPTLSLNGAVISTSVIDTGSTINQSHGAVEEYAADISDFTGQQNVTLCFESTGWNTLDDIEFSSAVVPEPSSPVLLATGVLLLALYLFHRRACPNGGRRCRA